MYDDYIPYAPDLSWSEGLKEDMSNKCEFNCKYCDEKHCCPCSEYRRQDELST